MQRRAEFEVNGTDAAINEQCLLKYDIPVHTYITLTGA